MPGLFHFPVFNTCPFLRRDPNIFPDIAGIKT
jgi:hypothetical protein